MRVEVEIAWWRWGSRVGCRWRWEGEVGVECWIAQRGRLALRYTRNGRTTASLHSDVHSDATLGTINTADCRRFGSGILLNFWVVLSMHHCGRYAPHSHANILSDPLTATFIVDSWSLLTFCTCRKHLQAFQLRLRRRWSQVLKNKLRGQENRAIVRHGGRGCGLGAPSIILRLYYPFLTKSCNWG